MDGTQVSILFVVAILGFFLNAVTIMVFNRRSALRSPSNRFVLSLIGVNLFSVLVLTVLLTIDFFVFAVPLKSILSFFETHSVITSVFCTLAISLDRYNAVLSPLHYTMKITRQRSCCTILFVCLISAVIAAPSYCRYSRCFPQYDRQILPVYSGCLFGVGFLIPLMTLIRVYVMMYRAAHRNSERTRKQSLQTSEHSRGGSLDSAFSSVVMASDLLRNGKSSNLIQINKRRYSNASISALLFREEGRAVKTAVMVIATFVLCWGPFFIFLLFETIVDQKQKLFQFFSILLAFCNAIISPFLYVYRNEIARHEAMRILIWWRKTSMYKGNVLHQASLDAKSDHVIRVRHQNSSTCDSMSVQSFQLPTSLNFVECKKCAEIPQPPSADFVATYEIFENPMRQERTRGESVTFRLAFLPQRKCQMCSRQNSDSSSGSGFPLIKESDPAVANVSSLRRGESDEYPLQRKSSDSPKTRGDVIMELEDEQPAGSGSTSFQFQESSQDSSTHGDSVYMSNEDLSDISRKQVVTRHDSDLSHHTADSGIGISIDRSLSSSSSIASQMMSPVTSRPKRVRHKLQRLAAVEDEDGVWPIRNIQTIKMPPGEFG